MVSVCHSVVFPRVDCSLGSPYRDLYQLTTSLTLLQNFSRIILGFILIFRSYFWTLLYLLLA